MLTCSCCTAALSVQMDSAVLMSGEYRTHKLPQEMQAAKRRKLARNPETTLCKYYSRGSCNKGESCPWLHSSNSSTSISTRATGPEVARKVIAPTCDDTIAYVLDVDTQTDQVLVVRHSDKALVGPVRGTWVKYEDCKHSPKVVELYRLKRKLLPANAQKTLTGAPHVAHSPPSHLIGDPPLPWPKFNPDKPLIGTIQWGKFTIKKHKVAMSSNTSEQCQDLANSVNLAARAMVGPLQTMAGPLDSLVVVDEINHHGHNKLEKFYASLHTDSSEHPAKHTSRWWLHHVVRDSELHQAEALPICLTDLLTAVNTIKDDTDMRSFGLYLAWRLIRTTRFVCGCPPLRLSFWIGMSIGNAQAEVALADCGIYTALVTSMPMCISVYATPMTPICIMVGLKRVSQRNVLAMRVRRFCVPSHVRINIICSCWAAFKQFAWADLRRGGQAYHEISGSTVYRRWCMENDIHADGEYLNVEHLLKLAEPYLPRRTEPQTFVNFIYDAVRFGWARKARLAACADVMAMRVVFEVAKRRGWRLGRGRLDFLRCAFCLHYPQRIMAMVPFIPRVGIRGVTWEQKHGSCKPNQPCLLSKGSTSGRVPCKTAILVVD